jgi:hypothetical protein
MKPIFTIHVGEYLAGEALEKRFRACDVWVPVKDTGTDLLLADKTDRRRNVSIQVKYSKDFLPAASAEFRQGFTAFSWFNFPPPDRIRESPADVWILALYSFQRRGIVPVIIEPARFAGLLEKIGNAGKFYLTVTNDNRCFATRGLKKADFNRLLAGDYQKFLTGPGDFTPYLENWDPLSQKLDQGKTVKAARRK